jgi:hypothetical protein
VLINAVQVCEVNVNECRVHIHAANFRTLRDNISEITIASCLHFFCMVSMHES